MRGCRDCGLGSGFGFDVGAPRLPSAGSYVKASSFFAQTVTGPPPPAPIMATTFEAQTQALDAAAGRDSLRIDPGGMYERASQRAAPVPTKTVDSTDGAEFEDRSETGDARIDASGGLPWEDSSPPEKQTNWTKVALIGGAALVAGFFIQRMF